MSLTYSLEALAESVQEWCETHHVSPANGQAAEQISERSIRYYRSLGLLDSATGDYRKTFTEKHRLQLLAIRIYQALGLPLRLIHGELAGKSESALRLLVRQAERGASRLPSAAQRSAVAERWLVLTLSDDFLLVSRQGKPVPVETLEQIKTLLNPGTVLHPQESER